MQMGTGTREMDRASVSCSSLVPRLALVSSFALWRKMFHSQPRAQYGNEAILVVFINHYISVLNENLLIRELHRESEST